MAFYFSPYEVASLSMRVEEAGMIFYTKVANLMRDDHVRNIFTFLSKQEDKHKKVFEDLAQETEKIYQPSEYLIDVRTEIENTIDLLKEKSFEMDRVSSDSYDLLQAIEVGIQTEIQSISVYKLAKKVLADSFATTLDQIVSEEEKHLEMLEKLRKENQGQ